MGPRSKFVVNEEFLSDNEFLVDDPPALGEVETESERPPTPVPAMVWSFSFIYRYSTQFDIHDSLQLLIILYFRECIPARRRHRWINFSDVQAMNLEDGYVSQIQIRSLYLLTYHAIIFIFNFFNMFSEQLTLTERTSSPHSILSSSSNSTSSVSLTPLNVSDQEMMDTNGNNVDNMTTSTPRTSQKKASSNTVERNR